MHAQVMERKTGVDTLSLAERISVRTNAADWLLLTPNIGVEYDIRNTNWSRWSIGLNLRSNWQSSHTYKPGIVYNLTGIRAEVRNYRRTRQIEYTDTIYDKNGNPVSIESSKGLKPHYWPTARFFSTRRKKIKYPLNTYYRGLYLSYNDFSLKFAKEGKQGSALGVGMTYGIIRPLYEYPNGNSIDFELGISGGIAYTKYDTYRHDRESDCYSVVESKDWHIIPYPVISEVKVGFVYRFGNYPITKKYRWRYDVDIPYQNKYDSITLAKDNWRTYGKKDRADSLRNAKLEKHKADSINKVTKKADKLKAKLADELRDSLRKDSIQKAKIENKRLKQVEEALQDSLKAVKQLEKKRDKAKKKEEEENNTEAEEVMNSALNPDRGERRYLDIALVNEKKRRWML